MIMISYGEDSAPFHFFSTASVSQRSSLRRLIRGWCRTTPAQEEKVLKGEFEAT